MATGQCAETCPSGYEYAWSTNDHQMGRVCSTIGLCTYIMIYAKCFHKYLLGDDIFVFWLTDRTIFGNIKLSGQVATITIGVIIGFLIVTSILLIVGMVVKFKKCSNFRSKSRMSPSLGPLTSGSHRSQGFYFL